MNTHTYCIIDDLFPPIYYSGSYGDYSPQGISFYFEDIFLRTRRLYIYSFLEYLFVRLHRPPSILNVFMFIIFANIFGRYIWPLYLAVIFGRFIWPLYLTVIFWRWIDRYIWLLYLTVIIDRYDWPLLFFRCSHCIFRVF